MENNIVSQEENVIIEDEISSFYSIIPIIPIDTFLIYTFTFFLIMFFGLLLFVVIFMIYNYLAIVFIV
jgi:hypothetical protein